ncbi:elongator protein 2 [Actinidia rufa]|uniref:Elongator complex protein 2 n=1 Tax=Actinidia rufa TaxID=165716 RepID=A0A7J0GZ01_9ERIC|nr:elongator protein 2 [Actinidia rufa]
MSHGAVQVEKVFIGAGCNRSREQRLVGRVQFGRLRCPKRRRHLFCPKTAQILTTLPGHQAAVNCTHWLPSTKFAFKVEVCVLQVPQPHKKGVTCITGIMISQTDVVFASTSSDGTVNIWELILPSSSGGERYGFEGSLCDVEMILATQPVGDLVGDCKLSRLESLFVGPKAVVALSLAELPGSSGPPSPGNGGIGQQDPYLLWIECHQPQSILSASMDKTMMIWQPERTTGIWMNVVTVGELSHCALGFYGGHWSPNGDAILAHGYGGSFHLWRNVGVDVDNWQPQKVPSGHFAEVTDIAWARSGEYLLSVSHDQTTRIFAPWHKEPHLKNGDTWHEIARPQVHGHDINCVTIIQGKGNHRFVSGAEEKVARVFEVPFIFSEDIESFQCKSIDTLETIPDAVPVELTEPPIEEQLAWHTLWPESHKLYGHGNELFSLCCDHEQKLVASSYCCSWTVNLAGQSASVAEIWLWQVGTWKAVGRLQSHSLTVTQMEFSHDDNFLLSVSRDRQFSVFSIKRTGVDKTSYQLVTRQEAHKRIIWTCSWNPLGHEFATGSRDKTVKIWAIENGSSVKQLMTLPLFGSSVTALSWVGLDRSSSNGLLAVGMENGLIELWRISVNRTEGCAPFGVAETPRRVRILGPLSLLLVELIIL